jgi:hypothetical protein
MRQGCIVVGERARGGAGEAGCGGVGWGPPPIGCARMDVPNARDGEMPPDHAEDFMRIYLLRWGVVRGGGEGRVRAHGAERVVQRCSKQPKPRTVLRWIGAKVRAEKMHAQGKCVALGE